MGRARAALPTGSWRRCVPWPWQMRSRRPAQGGGRYAGGTCSGAASRDCAQQHIGRAQAQTHEPVRCAPPSPKTTAALAKDAWHRRQRGGTCARRREGAGGGGGEASARTKQTSQSPCVIGPLVRRWRLMAWHRRQFCNTCARSSSAAVRRTPRAVLRHALCLATTRACAGAGLQGALHS